MQREAECMMAKRTERERRQVSEVEAHLMVLNVNSQVPEF